MKYLLIGIQGVYNYGCEAIIRGTERIIRSVDPDADIVYATPCAEEDARRLAGTDIRFMFRRIHAKYSWARISAAVLKRLKWNIPVRLDECGPYLREKFDYVLSIGGDMYTLNYQKLPPLQMMALDSFFAGHHIPFVLWGASVGPFGQNAGAEKQVSEHLRKMKAITAREPETIAYLKTLNITENVVPCGDPAFAVAPEIRKERDSFFRDGKIRIALNLSPLSAAYVSSSPEKVLQEQRMWLMRQLEREEICFTLIPHVVPPAAQNKTSDSDLIYLRKLRDGLPDSLKERVSVLSSDPGFIGTKKELVKCDLCIAARMHCAINAASAHVPVIFLSYSAKSRGLSKMIYGDGDHVFPLSDMDKLVIAKEKIRKDAAALEKNVPEIRELAFGAGRIFQKDPI